MASLNKLDISGITWLMTGNRVRKVYKEGKPTDETNGITVQCVAQEAGYEAVSFHLPDVDQLLIPDGEEPAPGTVVEFVEPLVTVYGRSADNGGGYGISAKAKSARIVSTPRRIPQMADAK